jgi:CheY-like chemotaxis protein
MGPISEDAGAASRGAGLGRSGRRPPGAPDRQGESAGTSRRVCLIDDEEAVRTTMASLLRSLGHHVIEAQNGADGLACVAEHRVDVVITDLGMPGMTGWDVAERLKAADPARPVILLTGWGQDAPAAPGEARVDRVLGKPIRLAELHRSIVELTH